MDDGGADLGLDVVADQRQPRILEPPPPLLARGDEDGNAVHEGAAGLQRLLGIPAGRLLRADGQVGDENVRAGLAQGARDVVLTLGCFGDAGAQIAADAVHRRPAPHLDAQGRNVGEADGVVGSGDDRFGQVPAHLALRHVERGRELDVSHMIAAETHMHQARDGRILGRVAIEGDALHQGAGTVAHARDRNPHLPGSHAVTPVSGSTKQNEMHLHGFRW